MGLGAAVHDQLVGARGLPDGQVRTNPYSANNSRILVFRAGAGAALPAEMPKIDASKLGVRIAPPLLTASNETVFAGEQAFAAHGGPDTIPQEIEVLRLLIAGEDVYMRVPSAG